MVWKVDVKIAEVGKLTKFERILEKTELIIISLTAVLKQD